MPTELIDQPVRPTGSLYHLASGLADLVQLREEEELKPEERAVIEDQIKSYVAAEVRKVDGIRAYIRHCQSQIQDAKTEILRVTQYQNLWVRRLEAIEDITFRALKECVPPNAKGQIKVEGKTGSLAIQKNGGVLPLEITQPELVPDEYCRMVRVPNNDLIRAALESDCETCAGLGSIAVHTEEDLEPSLCGACGGDGKNRVPGARFAPRGERLVVK